MPRPTPLCEPCGPTVEGPQGPTPAQRPRPHRCRSCQCPLPGVARQRIYCPACAQAHRTARARRRRALDEAQQVEARYHAALRAIRQAGRYRMTDEVAWHRHGDPLRIAAEEW